MFRHIFRRHPSIKLNVLVYNEGNEWVAHCLQMDIVATGTSEKEVAENIFDLIRAQVVFAIDNDNLGYIFKPAPPEEWDKLAKATKCDIRKLKIKVSGTRNHQQSRPPIGEVELCFA